MEYRFKALGKTHILSLDRDGDTYKVSHEDSDFSVRPHSLSENRLVLDIDGHRKTFYLAECKDDLYIFHKGRQYELHRADRSEEFLADTGGFDEADNRVATPMPGRIVKVLVKEGDLVKAGQPVFIIESMKMENEVRSQGQGRVVKVFAAEGDSLNHGDPVVELEPLEADGD